jgi:hypothetical protein
MTALMFAAMGNMNGNSQRSYSPELPEPKRVLPGKFNGVVPKGCKLETVSISVEFGTRIFTREVDIVYGSEKSKQKLLTKVGFDIRGWLAHNYCEDLLEGTDFIIVKKLS